MRRSSINKKKVLTPSNKNTRSSTKKLPNTGLDINEAEATNASLPATELVNSRGGKIILHWTSSRSYRPEVLLTSRVRTHGQRKRSDELPSTTVKQESDAGIVNLKKPSDSEPDFVNVKSESATSSDLYSCNIDNISEAQIVDAIQSINYSIGNLVSNILDKVKISKLSYYSPKSSLQKQNKVATDPESPPVDDITLQSLLLDSRLSDRWDLVAEALLHDLICCLVHKHFFQGGHFFGVGSEEFQGYLETMFSKLVTDGKSDPIAIQYWRSMSVQAAFQMNGGIDSLLNDELNTELGRMLKMALDPPKKCELCESIVRGEQQSLLDIIHQARKLSFTIQHEIVSCQLLVTIAPSSKDTMFKYAKFDRALVCSAWNDMTPQGGDQVFGTYAFGLQRISGAKHDILIQPKVTTSALLRSVF